MASLRAAAASDPGLVRSSNQDSALVAEGLLAVADGMGGHAGGEVAATTAVRVLEASFGADRSVAGLVGAAERANQAIYAHSERQRELRGMGTTLTAAALVRERGAERLAVVNVGDSRAYLHTSDGLVQLTEDHSLVEEMVRQGEMTEAEAAVHPHRHILTRALGIDPSVEVDSWSVEPRPGSRLLLCSDGLTNECGDGEIAAVLLEHAEPAAAARALVARALDHGGSDNVTVVVADVVAGDAPVPDGAAAAEPAGQARRSPSAGVPPHRRPSSAPVTRRRRREDRVVTVWSILFVLALVGVLGGTAGFVEWFVRATYFIAFDGDKVAIYQGRPGGFLWFHPHIVEKTSLTRAKVFSPYVPLVEKGMVETSYRKARTVASKLGDANAFLSLPTAATSGSSGASGASGPSASPAASTASTAAGTSTTAATVATSAATTTTVASTTGGSG